MTVVATALVCWIMSECTTLYESATPLLRTMMRYTSKLCSVMYFERLSACSRPHHHAF